ncbi:LuxR C-terminal-related transcriptional regulator [Actinoplanes sp. NPDC051861]|uniref:helix-turn-helix transcriptional regulator n=1 Tax=Actinoplanes sp. NPDC051861 TaxID=3155170 RepID=UPI003427058F
MSLYEAVTDVYGDLRLIPVLQRLLRHTGRLTGSVAGSVSLIDAGRGCYVKAAEYGAHCQLGSSFPLEDGATGRAFGSRRPVVIPDYGQIRAGHLAAAHPARRGPAAAVPIWWRDDVIAVSVVFGPEPDALTTRGMDELETLSQSAAAAIVKSGRPVVLPFRVVPNPAPFTPREAEVLELLRHGLTYREIAGRLGLSAKTVEKHVGAIMRKTGSSNRTAAVVTAIDNGWVGTFPHTVRRTRGT